MTQKRQIVYIHMEYYSTIKNELLPHGNQKKAEAVVPMTEQTLK